MTISYTADVANASGFGCFTRILLRWKGSVYKLILKELAAYVSVYMILNVLYRTLLCQPGMDYYRHFFESLKAYCSIQMSSVPMTFGLGFYVSLIVKRWWDQYSLLPWPDSLAIFVVGLLRGLDERGRLIRRSIMRYVLLSYVIVLRRVSLRVRRRFPTLEHLVDAGLMRADELKIMEALNEKCSVSKWWMPLVWATNLVEQARQEQRLNNDPGMQTVLNEISAIRKGLTGVQHYDTISVPLVYTQVVTLAVYTYFAAALMGEQWVIPADPHDYITTYNLPAFEGNRTIYSEGDSDSSNAHYQPLDIYVPVFMIMQFIFYVGWLKVAETLINPFGEDDDDFELNYLIDRHMQVSYMIVDDMHNEHPELLKDMYFNQPVPSSLPYTTETKHYRKEEPKGSAEIKETLDSHSMTYYKWVIPFRASMKQPHGHHNHLKKPDDPHSSEYESIDPNLFNRMKDKIRKSRIRRNSRTTAADVATAAAAASTSVEDASSLYYSRRKQSVDQKSVKSFKSQKSIYAKMFGFRRSVKSSEQLTLPPAENGDITLVFDEIKSEAEDEEDFNRRQPKKSSVSSTGSTKLNYGRLASLTDDGEDYVSEKEGDSIPSQLRHLPAHLFTITEQNTPTNTTSIARHNPRQYPTAEGIFQAQILQQLQQQQQQQRETSPLARSGTPPVSTSSAGSSSKVEDSLKQVNPHVLQSPSPTDSPLLPQARPQLPPPPESDSHSHAYYPLGSDASAGGPTASPAVSPTGPRFTVEEVPNYEPILISRSPKGGLRKVTNSSSMPLIASPALPKRQPIMSLSIASVQQTTIPPSSAKPEIVITRASSSRSSFGIEAASSVSTDDDELRGPVLEKVEEKVLESAVPSVGKEDASSAFDSATYYV